MFDFPNAPSEGTIFSPTGGPVYVYTGGVWRMQGSGQVVTAEARNRIVNGAMQISQENGNTAIAAVGYPADQWQIVGAGTYGITSQRVQVTTPNGSRDRCRLTVTTIDAAVAATDYLGIRQFIEGIRIADFRWGIASAKQVILRFGFKAPAGTWTFGVRNQSGGRSYVGLIVISAGQANTDTEQVFVIPGDTAGTWLIDATIGIILDISVMAGTTFQGATGWSSANAWGHASASNGAGALNTFELFDVGLYLDPNATGVPPPWVMPDEAQELEACERYYYKTGGMFSGSATNGSTYYISSQKPTMRITPAYSGVNLYNNGFPAAIGSFEDRGTWYDEYRTCSATVTQGAYMSNHTLNARM
jgi:hypothetical protein